MADKTKRLLNKIRKAEPKTPIASEMFLPNQSGTINHPEMKPKLTNHPHQDVTTTASPSFDTLTITDPTVDWKFLKTTIDTSTNSELALQTQTSGATTRFGWFSKDGDGTDSVVNHIYGVGLPTDRTGENRLVFGWVNAGYFLLSTIDDLVITASTIEMNGDVDVVDDLTAGTIEADNGFDGSWTNAEGNEVTVVGGIITNVAPPPPQK